MKSRTLAERFAVPHTFTPDLTAGAAMIAVAGALARIFFGSLLFALWGVSAAGVWNAMPNPFLAWTSFVLMVAVFLAAMAGLMLGISHLVRSAASK